MIRSMTGFGRCETVIDGREITVEIKSVNHRYFEFSCRTPRGYGFLDDKLKSLSQSGQAKTHRLRLLLIIRWCPDILTLCMK